MSTQGVHAGDPYNMIKAVIKGYNKGVIQNIVIDGNKGSFIDRLLENVMMNRRARGWSCPSIGDLFLGHGNPTEHNEHEGC